MSRELRHLIRTVLAVVVLVAVTAAAAPAQAPDDTIVTLVSRTFASIRDEALAVADGQAVLRAAVTATQQALTAAGISDPPVPPVLVGRESDDLRAVVAYLQTASRAVASRSTEIVLAPALRAMVRVLNDPYGTVFVPAEFARYLSELRGEYASAGMQVDVVGGAIVISDITEGGPAARAGIRVGDVLLEVDSIPVAGRRPDAVLEVLHGRPGSTVQVTVRRPDGEVTQVSLIREQVREVPARAKMLEARVGYVRLLEFSEDAHADVERMVSRLITSGAQVLVFDLRDNGGGLVDEAVAVTSMFLSSGLVAIEEGRSSEPTRLDVRRVKVQFKGPVVVLVNGFTASASEIVAGALQDTGITLVGAKTYGKGTVQTIFFLPVGWGLRLTTARYRTRGGRSIDGVGLNPDVAIITPSEQIQGPGDSQLEMARLLARRRLETTGSVQPGVRP